MGKFWKIFLHGSHFILQMHSVCSLLNASEGHTSKLLYIGLNFHSCTPLNICTSICILTSAESTSSTHQTEDSYLGSSVSLHDSVEADNILTISGAHTTGSSSALSNGNSTSNYTSPQKVRLSVATSHILFYFFLDDSSVHLLIKIFWHLKLWAGCTWND